jgi:hypothetical protein
MEPKPNVNWMMARSAPFILISILSHPFQRTARGIGHLFTSWHPFRRRRPWTIHGDWKT